MLSAAGENLTLGQQNGVAENTGWLYANKPFQCFSRGTRLSRTVIGIENAWAQMTSNQTTYAFWHPAGHDYFILTGSLWKPSIGSFIVGLDISDDAGATWLTDGGGEPVCVGTVESTYASAGGWFSSSSGTVASLTSDDLVLARIVAKDIGADYGYISNVSAWCFASDQAGGANFPSTLK